MANFKILFVAHCLHIGAFSKKFSASYLLRNGMYHKRLIFWANYEWPKSPLRNPLIWLWSWKVPSFRSSNIAIWSSGCKSKVTDSLSPLKELLKQRNLTKEKLLRQNQKTAVINASLLPRKVVGVVAEW